MMKKIYNNILKKRRIFLHTALKTISLFTSLFLLTIFFSSNTHSQKQLENSNSQRPWEKFLKDERIALEIPDLMSTLLENNINMYYIIDRILPKVTVKIILENGTYLLPKDKSGVLELWAKLVSISDSEKWKDKKFIEYLEMRGTSFSVQSHFQRTIIYIRSLEQYIYQDINEIIRHLQTLTFKKEDVDFYKEEMISSMQRMYESPRSLAYLYAKKKLWENTVRSYHNSRTSISSIVKEDVEKWQKDIWQNTKIDIAVSGDLKIDVITKVLNTNILQYNLKSQESQINSLLQNLNTSMYPQQAFILPREIPQTTLLWQAGGMPHNSPDYYAWVIINFLLGGDSFTSHLMQEIRVKNGWAYASYSHYSTDQFTGSFQIFVQTQNQNVPNVVQKVKEILENPNAYIYPENVRRAKNSISKKFTFLYETSEGLLQQKLSMMWDNLPKGYLENFLKNIQNTNIDTIKKVFQKYFSLDSFFLTAVGPQETLNSNTSHWNAVEVLQEID